MDFYDVCDKYDFAQQVEGLAATVGSLESSHAASVGLYVRHIEDHVQEACAVREPSGGTPNKKKYPRPSKYRYAEANLRGRGVST